MTSEFQIVFTSDLHAHFDYSIQNPQHNVLETAALIKKLSSAYSGQTVLVDLGDFIQGSALSIYASRVLNDGLLFADAMNHIGYDYQILGNHEFNYLPDYYQPILNHLEAKILNANILNKEDNRPFKGQAYDVFTIDDLKIGVIGATTHIVPEWENKRHIDQLVFEDALAAVQYYYDFLRPKVDFLIVAYHGGLDDNYENQGLQMIDQMPGIDVLLTGHMHEKINRKYKETVIVQPGFSGEAVGQIKVEFDGSFTIDSKIVETDHTEDAELKALMKPAYSRIETWKNEVVGELDYNDPGYSPFEARLYGHPFLELINQIQLAVTEADFSGTTLINDSYKAFKGDITNQQILEAYPYYNNIAAINIKGAELLEALEHNLSYFEYKDGKILPLPEEEGKRPRYLNYDIYSGISLDVDFKMPAGNRIISATNERNNQEIEPEKRYKVALSQFRASGGRGYEKWFNQNVIEYISSESLSMYIYKFLEGDLSLNLDNIRNHYQHLNSVE